jgi:ABC-2 type transport system ATP-binding protein
MPIVVAENLVKSYGRVVTVNGLSLRVDEGSVMGLIGPNGAGKTTTIKMILGLMKPDEGHVKVFDQNPWDNQDIRSQIGVVYEKPLFPTNEKVLGYLERACRIFGVNESRALEVLKLVDLKEAYDRPIKALSAGMLQKFAIAHAIIHEPKFVVADEITSNLDPKARSSLLDLILQLHKDQKVTFLLSSHILPELSRVCDSVTIINEGKVYASGKLWELYEKFTARTIRVLTDKPLELSKIIKGLTYLRKVGINSQGISIKVIEEGSDTVFEDILRLAREVKAKILGIETASASLEELYRRVVDSRGLEYEEG